MSESEAVPKDKRNSAGWGASVACMLHLLQWPLITVSCAIAMQPPATPRWFPYVFGGWSATQFLYLLPFIWWLKRRNFKQAIKGVFIVAGIGVLLNGACDALMFQSARGG